jgi:DNA-binding SARP family transcriptional activator
MPQPYRPQNSHAQPATDRAGIFRISRGGAAQLEFKVLGDLEVWRNGHLLPLEAVKPRAILARLLLSPNQPVATRDILESVWGETRPPTARAVLHNQILRLRQVLEPDHAGPPQVIRTSRPGYAIRVAPEQVDLLRFQRLAEEGRRKMGSGDLAAAAEILRQALALWRGPLLGDVVPFLPRRWPELGRVEAQRAQALEVRVEADLRLGRAEVIDELESLLRRDPLRPRLHGLLMLALCRSDRTREALSIYQQTSRALGEELGGAALQRLDERDGGPAR